MRRTLAMCVALGLTGGAACTATHAATSEFDEALTRLVARFGGALQATDNDPQLTRVRAALRSRRLAIDLAVLETCLAQRERYEAFTDIPIAHAPAGCEGLWVPLTKPGDACDTGLACIDGFCSRPDWGMSLTATLVFGACGVCISRGGVGASCEEHGGGDAQDQCQPPLTCDGICRAPSPGLEGDACPCQGEGLVCVSSVCVQGKPAGAACTDDAECLSGGCRQGNVCGPRALGQSCDYSWECVSGASCVDRVCVEASEGSPCFADGAAAATACGEGLLCIDYSECQPLRGPGEPCLYDAQCPGTHHLCHEGRCVQPLAPGKACGSDPLTVCMDGSTCTGGVCTAWPALGAACTNVCARGVCVGGVCASKAVGAPCVYGSRADECGAGAYCSNSCDNTGCCAAEGRPGEACDSTSPCDVGSWCPAATKQCSELCVISG